MFSQNLSRTKSKLAVSFLQIVLSLVFSLQLFNCTNKNEKSSGDLDPSSSESVALQKTQEDLLAAEKKAKDNLKKAAEVIGFLASLEKESLKVVNSNIIHTQIEVLSFAFDKSVGIKRANTGFFCHQFEINAVGPMEYEIVAICEKPVKKLALLKMGENQGDITFYMRAWAPIVGDFTSLTADDRSCYYSLKDKSVTLFNCKKTVYGIAPEFIEELRLEKFEYNKANNDQLVLEGGVFRDLVKRREVKMIVPMTGAIEVIEKELKVRDDFEHLLKKRGR